MHRLTRSWILPAAVLIAVACGGSAVASTTATGTAASARPAVKICGEGPAVVRPASMILTCADDGELAEHLHWTSWTATRATAAGQVSWLTGGPTHATSHRWDSAAAHFTLTGRLPQAGGTVLFTTLHVQVTGRTPDKYMRDVTYSEAPLPITTLPHAPGQAAPPRTGRPNAASGTLGFAQIEGWWVEAGGAKGKVSTIYGRYPAPAVAAALTFYEASFAPGNIQLGNSYPLTGWGLWQITPGNKGNLTYGQDYQLLDPWNNAEQAVLKCKQDEKAGDTDGCWAPWTTYTSRDWPAAIPNPIPAPATGLSDPGEYIPYTHYTGFAHNSSHPGSTYGPRPPTSASGSTGAAVAVNPSTDAQYAFWRGTDGDLHSANAGSSGHWSSTVNMCDVYSVGCNMDNAPGAGVADDGTQYVFWLGTDNDLHSAHADPSGHWSSAVNMCEVYTVGCDIASAPAVAVNPSTDAQYVFWRGTDGDLHSANAGGSGHWSSAVNMCDVYSVGCNMDNAPGAGVADDGTQYVFWETTDSDLHSANAAPSGHWSSAVNICEVYTVGCNISSTPGVAVNPSTDAQYVFWRDSDGDLHSANAGSSGHWSSAVNMCDVYSVGCNMANTPGAAVADDGTQYAFWDATDNDLHSANAAPSGHWSSAVNMCDVYAVGCDL